MAADELVLAFQTNGGPVFLRAKDVCMVSRGPELGTVAIGFAGGVVNVRGVLIDVARDVFGPLLDAPNAAAGPKLFQGAG
jgi:hypothetical protein